MHAEHAYLFRHAIVRDAALAIHRQLGNRRFEGAHLSSYALVVLSKGGKAVARDLWREGTQILRDIGDTRLLETAISSMRKACEKAGSPAFDEPSP